MHTQQAALARQGDLVNVCSCVHLLQIPHEHIVTQFIAFFQANMFFQLLIISVVLKRNKKNEVVLHIQQVLLYFAGYQIPLLTEHSGNAVEDLALSHSMNMQY